MNRYVYIGAVLAAFLASGASISAQGGYTLSGTVADESGPVAGAAVIEQGTSNGTSTGPEGDYTLTVSSPDAPVEFSCIGYVSVQVSFCAYFILLIIGELQINSILFRFEKGGGMQLSRW